MDPLTVNKSGLPYKVNKNVSKTIPVIRILLLDKLF